MRKNLLLLAMLTSMIANAYEPMIREDRIWEFGLNSNFDDMQPSIKYRFSGTETKNEVTYNVLNIMWADGSLEPVALMREDVKNREIYVYCKQDIITIYGVNNSLSLNLGANKEVLLYCTPVREGFYIMPYGQVATFNQTIEGYYQLELFSLVHSETLNYLDTTRGFYCYRPYHCLSNSFPLSDAKISVGVNKGYYYVEGVGNVGFGAPYLPVRAEYLTCQFCNDNEFPYRFLRLTDPWGNTVFDARWIFGGSDIESVNAESRPKDGRKYDLQGVETDQPEPGSIYIENGEKHIAR